MSAFGLWQLSTKGCFGSTAAGQGREVCWSNPMQTPEQVECK